MPPKRRLFYLGCISKLFFFFPEEMTALPCICVKFAASLTQTACRPLDGFPIPPHHTAFTETCRTFGFGSANAVNKSNKKIFSSIKINCFN